MNGKGLKGTIDSSHTNDFCAIFLLADTISIRFVFKTHFAAILSALGPIYVATQACLWD